MGGAAAGYSGGGGGGRSRGGREADAGPVRVMPGPSRYTESAATAALDNGGLVGAQRSVMAVQDSKIQDICATVSNLKRTSYAIHEELQLLTSNRQSGGERSVSTILYLIALQVGGVEGCGGGAQHVGEGASPLCIHDTCVCVCVCV